MIRLREDVLVGRRSRVKRIDECRIDPSECEVPNNPGAGRATANNEHGWSMSHLCVVRSSPLPITAVRAPGNIVRILYKKGRCWPISCEFFAGFVFYIETIITNAVITRSNVDTTVSILTTHSDSDDLPSYVTITFT